MNLSIRRCIIPSFICTHHKQNLSVWRPNSPSGPFLIRQAPHYALSLSVRLLSVEFIGNSIECAFSPFLCSPQQQDNFLADDLPTSKATFHPSRAPSYPSSNSPNLFKSQTTLRTSTFNYNSISVILRLPPHRINMSTVVEKVTDAVKDVTASLGNISLPDKADHSKSGEKAGNSAQNDAVLASAAEGRRLYIGNLAYATTEGELTNFFKGYLV